jgi:GNAT superfamily N-acetyltransferase
MTRDAPRDAPVEYRLGGPVSAHALNGLMEASWPDASEREWRPVLQHSLAYVCAYCGASLVGFAHVAWDGGLHAFLLDPTVHPEYRRRGIGTELVRRAAEAARAKGAAWLHVDYTPDLAPFYEGCGFRHTTAGLMRL